MLLKEGLLQISGRYIGIMLRALISSKRLTIQEAFMYLSPNKMKFLLNIYPPYLGAGVSIQSIANDWKSLRVIMKLRWYNRNIVGTHFGGSLYSMVDPHLMLMLMQLLGREYYVWDKAARIEYCKPAASHVYADILITDSLLDKIKTNTQQGEKYLPEFEILVKNKLDETVAIVHKQLYTRRKPEHREK